MKNRPEHWLQREAHRHTRSLFPPGKERTWPDAGNYTAHHGQMGGHLPYLTIEG
jgi:hypothetical protein